MFHSTNFVYSLFVFICSSVMQVSVFFSPCSLCVLLCCVVLCCVVLCCVVLCYVCMCVHLHAKDGAHINTSYADFMAFRTK